MPARVVRDHDCTMRSTVRVATTAVTLLALGGCGAADRAPDAGAASTSGTPSAGASNQMDVPDPYHLADADWATDLDGAAEFYDQMPATFQGVPVRRPGGEAGSGAPGVTYGPANTGVTAYSMGTDEEVPDAKAVLATMFGIGMICDKTTYRGTAEPMRGGLIPGFGSDEEVDPWWFACEVDGAEGAPNLRAYAVGWTSGDLGWLTVTPDERTSRELLAVMVERARG